MPVTAGPGATVTGAYSVDDGRTWRRAPVTGTGDRRALRVVNPATGFVSLRVTGTGATGDTATITVLRAYEVG
ncbi:hypothetical protein [Actinoplanes sp. NPDC051494]|uniref:hypothetical protein n=1 Tax=Actinoplanes sp. NPDC051494 TaxID=3363907 RepID=UPI00378B7515